MDFSGSNWPVRRPRWSSGRVVLAVAVLLVISACGSGGGSSSSGGSKVAKIGMLAPLTGQSSADGQEMVRGAQLAVDELNASGGVAGYKLQLVTGDVQDQKPDAVVSNINRISADSDVNAFIAGYASGTDFELNNMADLKMPYILSANSAQMKAIVEKNPSRYNCCYALVPVYDAYGTDLPKKVEQWASEGKLKLHNRKAYVITSDNPYSRDIAVNLVNTLKSMNWTITGNDTVPLTQIADWGSEISKIRNDPPDLVINTDYLTQNEATFTKQFLQNPTNSLVFMQFGPSLPEFIDLTKDQSTGVVYNLFGAVQSPKMPRTGDIQKKFTAKYGLATGGEGFLLYEELNLYADALRKVGNPKDRTAIMNAMAKTDKTVSVGHVVFDPKTHLCIYGDNYYPLQFFQIWQGQRVLLSPPKYADGSFQLPPWMHN
jgi:branched-chain amino acid transport system substrate-binding protein